MRDFVCFIVLAVGIPISAAQAQQSAAPPSNSIDPPAGEKLLLEVQGDGVQIYSCTVDQGAAVWKLQGPDAKLTEKGVQVGTHSAGPTWKLLDGSEVKGSKVGTKPATEQGAVEWLLLKVVSETGDGKLRTAEYITRTDTKGGLGPSTGCDAAHQGQQARIPYTAKYTFYTK